MSPRSLRWRNAVQLFGGTINTRAFASKGFLMYSGTRSVSWITPAPKTYIDLINHFQGNLRLGIGKHIHFSSSSMSHIL
jgi:hypothetical protein